LEGETGLVGQCAGACTRASRLWASRGERSGSGEEPFRFPRGIGGRSVIRFDAAVPPGRTTAL
jgi:hypothetical protein